LPGTITVDGVQYTDAAGDDVAEFVPPAGSSEGHVSVNLGTGADATHGGSIPRTSGSPQHTVTFDVRVATGVTDKQQIVNAASLVYRGLTTQATSAAATNAALGAVTAVP